MLLIWVGWGVVGVVCDCGVVVFVLVVAVYGCCRYVVVLLVVVLL